MPGARFEPGIPIFERPKTVLALDRSAIETGEIYTYNNKHSLRSNTNGYGGKTH
jgi:hypothetical protein